MDAQMTWVRTLDCALLMLFVELSWFNFGFAGFLLQRSAFSLHCLLLLGSAGSRTRSCRTWGLPPHSMWNPPGAGIEPTPPASSVSPASSGRFLTPEPLVKFSGVFLNSSDDSNVLSGLSPCPRHFHRNTSTGILQHICNTLLETEFGWKRH